MKKTNVVVTGAVLTVLVGGLIIGNVADVKTVEKPKVICHIDPPIV